MTTAEQNTTIATTTILQAIDSFDGECPTVPALTDALLKSGSILDVVGAIPVGKKAITRAKEKIRGRVKTLVKNGLLNEFDADNSKYYNLTDEGKSLLPKNDEASGYVERKQRTQRVTGTGTWRDGLTEKQAAEYDKWATEFIATEIRSDEILGSESSVFASFDDEQLKGHVIRVWLAGGKGFNIHKLRVELRAQNTERVTDVAKRARVFSAAS